MGIIGIYGQALMTDPVSHRIGIIANITHLRNKHISNMQQRNAIQYDVEDEDYTDKICQRNDSIFVPQRKLEFPVI